MLEGRATCVVVFVFLFQLGRGEACQLFRMPRVLAALSHIAAASSICPIARKKRGCVSHCKSSARAAKLLSSTSQSIEQ